MKKTFLILKIFLLLALFAAAGANVYAADYYWVGRDINDPLDWDRIANWSNVSGGSGGRTSPPVSIDDVHFDANSFTATRKTVNLTTNSYCRNIVFANVPAGTVFNFGTQTFEVSGSFTLAAGMITSGTGIIRFVSANAAENLTANQVVIYPNVEIRGTAQWTIDAPFRTDTTGTTTRGTFTYANPNSLTVPGDMRVANITWSGGGGLTVNGNLTARYDISANPYFGGGTSHSGAGDIKVTGNFTTYTLTFSTGKTAQDSIIVGGTLTTYNTNFNGGGSLITNAWVATSTTTFSGGGDITVGTVWTNNGYVNFTGNGNITVGTSFTGASTFYANGNGNITIGQAGNTGEVFKITGNQTSNSPYYYNSVRMLGTGTKTFNGDVNAYYSTSFQGGTVNIKGSLNVQTGVTSASYCSEIYHSLINGGCLFTVDGDVTARNVTTPATQTLGSRFVVTDAGTAVNVGGSFTQGYLHILDGVTNIQGKLTLRGYSTACADMYSSLLITGGELNFNIAGVQNVDIMGNFTSRGGTLTGIGGATVNVGRSWEYSGTSNVVLTKAVNTTPALIHIHSGGFTARDYTQGAYAGEEYTAADFGNSNYFPATAPANDYLVNYGAFDVSDVHSINMGRFDKIQVTKGYGNYSTAAIAINVDTMAITSRLKQRFNNTTTVNDSLRIRPSECGGMIPVLGGNIAMGNPSVVDAENLLLENNTITGATPYTAAHSVDYGGNSGWNIVENGVDFYWIGGAGNWNDPAHWSYSSGGASCGCIPTLLDNVFFDVNSRTGTGTTGYAINTAATSIAAENFSPAYCHNFTVTADVKATPTFTFQTPYPLVISGSLFVGRSTQLTFTAANYYYFVSGSNETITTNGALLGASATAIFSSRNGAGKWTLADNLAFGAETAVTGYMYLICGELDLNGKNLIVGHFDDNNVITASYNGSSSPYNLSLNNCTRSIDISNSTITARQGWRYNTAQRTPLVAATSDNSLIKITASSNSYSNSQVTDFRAGAGDKYWNLEFTAGSAYTYTTQTYGYQPILRTLPSIDNGILNKVTILGTNAQYANINLEETDSLLLSQATGATYYLHRDIPINKYLYAGECGAFSVLRSVAATYTDVAVTPYTITMGNGATVRVKSMQIGGTAANATTAQYGVNITGVSMPASGYSNESGTVVQGTGWDTAGAGKRTWYWTGGTGNWTEVNKWSSISGTQDQTGAEHPCQPPANPDNVVFDDGSFTAANQIVTVNVNSTCDSMIWDGSTFATLTPQLYLGTSYGSNTDLGIYGSFILDTGVKIGYTGFDGANAAQNSNYYIGSSYSYHNIYLYSTRSNETFKTAGTKMWAIVRFQSSAVWDIPDGIETNGYIYFGTNSATYDAASYNFGGNLTNYANPRYSTYSNYIYYYAGNLNMAEGTTITADAFTGTIGRNTRQLKIKNVTVNVKYGSWSYDGQLTAANSENSVINLEYGGSNITLTATVSATVNQVYNDVNFTNTAPSTVSITRTVNGGTYQYKPTFRKITFYADKDNANAQARTKRDVVNYANISYLDFRGHGTMNGLTVDTLEFNNDYSWQYLFAARYNATATPANDRNMTRINSRWYGNGTNCKRIYIESTANNLAYVSVAKAAANFNDNPADVDTLMLDFIYLRYIGAAVTSEAGTDGERATLIKGNQSPDQEGSPSTTATTPGYGIYGFNRDGANNGIDAEGNPSLSWTEFGYAGSAGFLGIGQPEYLVYKNQSITLNSQYFMANRHSTYQWRKGTQVQADGRYGVIVSTDPSYTVTTNVPENADTYYLYVDYADDGTCLLDGHAKITLLIDPYRWYYLSSPYSNAPVKSLRPVGNHDGDALIGYYSEAKHAWESPIIGNNSVLGGNYTIAPNDTNAVLIPGRGFAASVDSMSVKFRPPTVASFDDFNFSGTTTVPFIFTPNSNVSVPISNTVADPLTPHPKRGNNLVGNPYGDYLDFDMLAAVNPDISTTYHIRGLDTRGLSADHRMKYDSYNAASHTGTAVIRPTPLTQYIAPVQAFWVFLPNLPVVPPATVASRTSTLAFTPAMATQPTGNPIYAPQSNRNKIARLDVYAGKRHGDQTIFVFNPAASNAYDKYDSPKMSNGEKNIPELYTLLDNQEIIINGMQQTPVNQEIPLGFRTGVAGMFSIGATTENLDDTDIILVDNLLGSETNITGKRYYFASNVVNDANRFGVVFRNNGNASGISNATANNRMIVYVNDDNRVVVTLADDNAAETRLTAPAQCRIFNVAGQLLAEEIITATPQILKYRFDAGVYLIKVANETSRVIIK